MAKRLGVRFKDIHGFPDSLFGDDVHAKRVYSLANATLGVMTSASLAIHAVGQGLAQARGKLTKHAVKQVDRLLSNAGVEVWSLFATAPRNRWRCEQLKYPLAATDSLPMISCFVHPGSTQYGY